MTVVLARAQIWAIMLSVAGGGPSEYEPNGFPIEGRSDEQMNPASRLELARTPVAAAEAIRISPAPYCAAAA